jgi:hypothetical protein
MLHICICMHSRFVENYFWGGSVTEVIMKDVMKAFNAFWHMDTIFMQSMRHWWSCCPTLVRLWPSRTISQSPWSIFSVRFNMLFYLNTTLIVRCFILYYIFFYIQIPIHIDHITIHQIMNVVIVVSFPGMLSEFEIHSGKEQLFTIIVAKVKK